MQIVRIENIKVRENRQRREFDDEKIQALVASIESKKGLMHPLVVEQIGDEYYLVAGERRLKAIGTIQILGNSFLCNQSLITPGYAPVTLLSEMSEIEREEAELEENVLRVDLTLQEHALAVARLHKLREKQKGSQTLTETAREVSSDAPQDVTVVRQQLLIAEHMDVPEVAKAKTRKEAIKAIEKIKTAENRAKLAEAFDLTKTEHRIIHGSSFDIAPTLEASFFDLIVTDPPYGVGADTFGSQSSGHNYKDDYEYGMQCYELVAKEGWRVTKPQASVYAFCDIRFFPDIALTFKLAGWEVWDRPLIWAKSNGMLPKPDFGPRNTYEAILFAYKPNTKIKLVGQSDVISIPLDKNLEHGAQKPVELFVELIKRSAEPNANVVDFFAGSGTIFPASNKTKVRAVGIEFVKANYDIALSRINLNLGDDLDDLLAN